MFFFRHDANPGASAHARAVGASGHMSDAGCVFCKVISALEHADTYPAAQAGQVLRKVRDLPASIAILAPDQYYKGYTMVVSKTHAVELYELPERQSTQYFQDMVAVARAIAAAFKPRKMNYEALGNAVGHLHWHLFPRYEWDPHPKRPIWETNHSPRLPSPEEYADTVAAIRRHLA
jgi:diadenosine tetraphosphate (Ap4A) HIT family hydrolase